MHLPFAFANGKAAALASGQCKKVGPIIVAAATAFNKYYKIVWPMRSLAYSVSREPFAIRFGFKICKA